MFRFATVAALAFAALLIAPVGIAASQGNTKASLSVKNMDRDEFLAYHTKLARDLNTSKYKHVTNSSRDKIAAAQAQIRKTLANKASLEQLDADERMRVFNAHENVIALMNDSNLDRVVCKRHHQMGSHRPKMECRTVRESKDMADRQRLDNLRTRNCGSGEACTGG